MSISLLNKENTGLIIVDVQEKLMKVMGNPDRVVDRIVKLLHLSRVFKLPVILTEQYSKWLGPTLPPIKEALPEYDPIEKLHFNSCNVDLFNNRVEKESLRNIILMGVETHICVFQTCVSLLEKGYNVQVPSSCSGFQDRGKLEYRTLPYERGRGRNYLCRDHHFSDPQEGRYT